MRKDPRLVVLYTSLIFASLVVLLNLWTNLHVVRTTTTTGTSSTARDRNSTGPKPSQERHHPFDKDGFTWSKESRDWTLSSDDDDDNHFGTLLSQQARVKSCLWPEQQTSQDCPDNNDRIINQLKSAAYEQDKLFKISVANDYSLPAGQAIFLANNCTVNKCLVTQDLDNADAIIFPNSDVRVEVSKAKRIDQIWIAQFLESPPNTFDKRFERAYRGKHVFNWTASYRSDSDIVTPYAKFVPYNSQQGKHHSITSSFNGNNYSELERKFHAKANKKHQTLIANKQTRVAWFVSNCHAKNNRLEFAQELAKFIPVDIYGKCGNLTCHKWNQAECLRSINKNYKFYLAFENSNNREYITEKLYKNALGYNEPDHLLLPIVMGPPREDYARLAPPGSFIHVDDFESAEHLANFLLHLGHNDASYYSYFRWKTLGKFVETKFICRVCSMLHKSHMSKRVKTISNIKEWWLNETAA